MPSTRETVLSALNARLQTLSAPVLRGEVLPERIPATGLIILRDGKPGEPEVTMSPLTYFYEHRAELEVVIHNALVSGVCRLVVSLSRVEMRPSSVLAPVSTTTAVPVP